MKSCFLSNSMFDWLILYFALLYISFLFQLLGVVKLTRKWINMTSRQQCWEPHLESLNTMVPWYFCIWYSKLCLFIACLHLKHGGFEGKGTWYVIKHDNFSVNRSPVPFSLIGTDHGLEHQNHPVGVLRGIKGISNGLAAFDECFMITGEMFIP